MRVEMGKITGTCSVCGKTGVEVFKCRVCGEVACLRCFMNDINVCTRCLRRGLWVGES